MTSPDSLVNKEKVAEFSHADNALAQVLTHHQQQSAIHMAKVNLVAAHLNAILNDHFGIDRSITMGAIGNRTTSSTLTKRCTDLDLIVFFNFSDLCPEKLQQVVSKLPEKMSSKISCYKILFTTTVYPSAGMVKVVDHIAQVVIDIYVAVNLAPSPEVQWKQVLFRHCKAADDSADTNLNYLNASHLEMVKKYVVNCLKDSFVEQVVQLAQIWNDKCAEDFGLILHPIPGRNRVIELVAIRAAQEETRLSGTTNRSLTSALKLFLEYMRTPWRNLQIVFQQDVRFPQSCQATFQNRLKEFGILLDPVNPYLNYLNLCGFKYHWPGIQGAAQVCLDCLELVRRGKRTIEDVLGLKESVEKVLISSCSK